MVVSTSVRTSSPVSVIHNVSDKLSNGLIQFCAADRYIDKGVNKIGVGIGIPFMLIIRYLANDRSPKYKLAHLRANESV